MEDFGKEYYQQMIRLDTHDTRWTQFELDLIRCIRDEYPVIFTKMGQMNRHQRAGKIRSAWKQISNKFSELPMTYIKARWRSILDHYLKVKIYADSTPDFTEALVKNKFMDGTLSFLEGEVDLFFDHHKAKKPGKNQNPDEESEDERPYALEIEKMLHEEIDLDEDEIGTARVKEEVYDAGEEHVERGNETHNAEPGTVNVKQESEVKWTEEELMNATRLTKDMIDQLILIKTRNYYMSPVVNDS